MIFMISYGIMSYDIILALKVTLYLTDKIRY